MKIDNLLMHCEHPKQITTKSGDVMLVSCGKCRSCLIDKARSRSSVIQHHSVHRKYCFFVTLTYNNMFVPRAYPLYLMCDDKQCIELYDVETGELLHALDFNHTSCRSFIASQNRSTKNDYMIDTLMYARFSDCQKFIKRLRKQLNKYSDEKITYFATSEYGTKSKRPHFHILLWFDDPVLSQVIRQVVSTCWKLGYNYTTLSRGETASYVASYLNCTIDLPRLFKVRFSKAKSSHSFFFGLPVDQSKIKEIWKNEPAKFVRYFFHTDKKGNKSFSAPWRSFNSRFFPKCQGYSLLTYYQRVRLYGLYATLLRRFPRLSDETLVHYAHFLYDYAKTHNNKNCEYISLLFNSPTSLTETTKVIPPFDIFLSRFYQIHHYYNMMCFLEVTPYQYVSSIDKYYSSLDYTNLKEEMELRENLSSVYSEEEAMMFNQIFCYGFQYDTNIADTFEYYLYNGNLYDKNFIQTFWFESSFFQDMMRNRIDAYINSVKHKQLNDDNNIFLNNMSN